MNLKVFLSLSNVLVITVTVIILLILFSKRVRTASLWHATVTPLASIIGSGFLICAPLLALAAGKWSALVMLAIVLVAYGLGASLRFNILNVEPNTEARRGNRAILLFETWSRAVLGIAYIISVAFYLKLLSAFALHALGDRNSFLENILTSIIILFIGISGKLRGLSFLEVLETYAVNLKLSIIIALIAGLIEYNFLHHSHLILWNPQVRAENGWVTSLREILGTLIIVQGFETSRYLGSAYSATIRVITMRYAQWISGVIYVCFIFLCLPLFHNIHVICETLVIRLSAQIALVLPFMLIVAGVMSQFSAAIADTIASAGLLSEATQERLKRANGYLVISVLAIVLVWLTNIFRIVVIASKAFAIYYALQLLISLMTLKQRQSYGHQFVIYMGLFVLMVLVVLFGISVS